MRLADEDVGARERIEQGAEQGQVQHEEVLRPFLLGHLRHVAEQIDRRERLLDDAKRVGLDAAGDRTDVLVQAIEIDEHDGRADGQRVELARESVEVARGRIAEHRWDGRERRGAARPSVARGSDGVRRAAREIGGRAGRERGDETAASESHDVPLPITACA